MKKSKPTGINSSISPKKLVLLYDRIMNNLNRNNENYARIWGVLAERRDKLVERDCLYSKKIKLKKHWYKPGDHYNG